MCRNIRPLFNYEPPATQAEIHDAALQFVRKVSGFQTPSELNEKAFDEAVEAVTDNVQTLLSSLVTKAPKRNREEEIQKRRELAKKRFGR